MGTVRKNVVQRKIETKLSETCRVRKNNTIAIINNEESQHNIDDPNIDLNF